MSSRARRVRRIPLVPAILLGVVAVALLCTSWVGVRGVMAASHLFGVRDAATELITSTEIDSGTLEALQEDAHAAHSLTGDPIWAAAEKLPWVGPQLGALGALSEAADQIASDALPALAPVITDPGAFAPQNGRFPLDEIAALAGVAGPAADSAEKARRALLQVDTDALLEPVRGPFEQAREQIDAAAGAVRALDMTAELLPSMLGGQGARDYLLVFQNNAELRSLGGMPGSFARLHADDGAIALTGQYTASDFTVTEPAGEVPTEIATLYRETNRAISATTQIPDFSVAAELLLDYWTATQEGEGALDGVISLDPVALSYLLEATGPVTVANGETITSANAVDILLNDVYLRFSPEEQNAYFASTAAAVFSAVAAGQYDPRALIASLARASSERRLLIYSTDASEQKVLQKTSLAGALPPDGDFGVYLNDGTGSKMDYYLHADAEAVTTGSTSTLTLTLRSDAPEDAAELPPSITGGGNYGVDPGVTRTVVYFYLPRGADLQDLDVGKFNGWIRALHDGREVLTTSIDLKPGESATIEVPVTLAGRDGLPEVVMTPQVR